jgi:hypothetical protein
MKDALYKEVEKGDLVIDIELEDFGIVVGGTPGGQIKYITPEFDGIEWEMLKEKNHSEHIIKTNIEELEGYLRRSEYSDEEADIEDIIEKLKEMTQEPV